MPAADELEGLTLKDGWKVVRRLSGTPTGTGGHFSQRYLVEKDGRMGFLKALDLREAFRPGVDTIKALQLLTTAYNHERDILTHCRDRRLSNIVVAIDHGDVQVPNRGDMDGRVFYLVFEMAEGDVRSQMDVTRSCDALWCMSALRGACLGLHQAHREMIAHQDLKPSNVLSFASKEFKVADFGRSSRPGHAVWYDDSKIAGDRTYAPPELLYGYVHPEFVPRRMGCDLYMLGNLAAFLFSGANLTAGWISYLDVQHRPGQWRSTYEGVLPYVQDAFARVLQNLEPLIDPIARNEVMSLVRELCNPDLAKRGHPRGIGMGNQYSLERYVSRLDLVVKQLAVRVRMERRAT